VIAAMVLSAGKGTRMRPLTDWRAKPLAPVGDRPALAHVVDALASAGITRIVANAHHRAGDVRAFAERDGRFVVSEEQDLLGTAGGVAHARALLGDGGDVLVWNGDILATVDVRALVAAHRADGTLLVRPGAAGSGNVGLAADGRVVRLRKETVLPGEVRGGEFLGVHVVGRALVRDLPARGCLVGDAYLPAMRAGGRLDAALYDGAFWDIGTVGAYLDANLAWLAARGVAAWVEGGAHVAPGVTLDRVLIHAGARVTGRGVLARAVLWEGATCEAPEDAVVVAPQGRARVADSAAE
jgi:mannose-1-phosphate guanylyltransferase